MKKILGMIVIIFIIIISVIFIFPNKENIISEKKESQIIYKKTNEIEEIEGIIILKDVDGNKKNYTFKYNGEIYRATYTKENWKIEDSYKINDKEIMLKICEELLKAHKIHGSDMVSYRTADDMVYEWVQHNLAYQVLPDGNRWKKSVKDVDFDPKDQGKSLKELYESRTGQKFIF